MLHGLILRVACKLGMCNIVALSVTFEGCRLTKKRGVVITTPISSNQN